MSIDVQKITALLAAPYTNDVGRRLAGCLEYAEVSDLPALRALSGKAVGVAKDMIDKLVVELEKLDAKNDHKPRRWKWHPPRRTLTHPPRNEPGKWEGR